MHSQAYSINIKSFPFITFSQISLEISYSESLGYVASTSIFHRLKEELNQAKSYTCFCTEIRLRVILDCVWFMSRQCW